MGSLVPWKSPMNSGSHIKRFAVVFVTAGDDLLGGGGGWKKLFVLFPFG